MLRALPPLIEPDVWTLAFHRTSPWFWVRLLAIGRYKHVSAFAWVQPYGMWVWYDITLFGTKIILLPDSQQALAWLTAQTADADLVKVSTGKSRMPLLAPFYCVSAVKHLVGIPGGALLPTTLFDDCLRHGGKLIHGRPGKTDIEPGAVAATAAGEG